MSAVADCPSELARVKALFDQWRARRSSPRERIPSPLWDAALALLDHVALAQVARTLRLSSQQLRRRRDTAVATPSGAPTSVRFLELPLAPLTRADARALSDPPMRLVLDRPDGARLSLTMASHEWERVEAVVAAFLSGSR